MKKKVQQTITILGSTGSIGKNTLDVIAQHPQMFFSLCFNGLSK